MKIHWDFISRLYGGAWFFLLAIVTVVTVPHQMISPSQLIAKTSIVLLYLLFGLMIWIRPAAKFQSQGVLPRLMAFIGSYMPWMISFFPQTDYAWANWLSPILVIGGILLAIVTILHLRTAYSIVPQARFIVRSGPYRWLRHPLYVVEEIAVIGVLLQHLSPITVLIVLGHIAVQVGRIYYEEELLGRSFPEYLSLAPRWRLVPFIY